MADAIYAAHLCGFKPVSHSTIPTPPVTMDDSVDRVAVTREADIAATAASILAALPEDGSRMTLDEVAQSFSLDAPVLSAMMLLVDRGLIAADCTLPFSRDLPLRRL
ncbi:hypothetical protein [Consotaella salsifontis]|uniref:DprA winged helix domain-containing protein n=1 Tax=Consotaella salsifontis TaxID=1365950 RepID=A0A1T4S1V2_9HYPH|nr:hypothetical protein [Consotaella salsifontis]SKA22213.1 hypothetical protein SAMN05428963_108184 [Consotaella salsifontis]